jgi:hypothetical protein
MQKIVIPRLLWYHIPMKESIMTTLRIIPEIAPLSSLVCTRNNWSVHRLLVARKGLYFSFAEKFQNLTNTENISIEVQAPEWKVELLELPEYIIQWITRYLQNSPKLSEATDCLGFIVEILWGKRGDRFLDDGDFSHHWETRFRSLQELIPGDIVFLRDSDEESFHKWNYHYALYIGKGLFLSKFFLHWPLVVQTFEQLREMNSTLDIIVKVLLKKK